MHTPNITQQVALSGGGFLRLAARGFVQDVHQSIIGVVAHHIPLLWNSQPGRSYSSRTREAELSLSRAHARFRRLHVCCSSSE